MGSESHPPLDPFQSLLPGEDFEIVLRHLARRLDEPGPVIQILAATKRVQFFAKLDIVQSNRPIKEEPHVANPEPPRELLRMLNARHFAKLGKGLDLSFGDYAYAGVLEGDLIPWLQFLSTRCALAEHVPTVPNQRF